MTRPASTPEPGARPAVRIVDFDPRDEAHRRAFRDLNLAWIERHFAVEERDRLDLDDPEGRILTGGGHIFVAEVEGTAGVEAVGTCALVVEHDGTLELAKMAVAAEARGLGIGRALGEAAVARARAVGAPRIELLSNRSLAPAIGLYRALGFVEAPLVPSEYARADIRMILELGAAPRG